jgi:hypothetical protein
VKTVLTDDLSAGLFLSAAPAAALVFSPAQPHGRFYSECYRPPPTDLVITLQHLLI